MNPQMMVRILLNLIADRIFLTLTLLLNFALFAYAVIYPDLIRFAVAGMFSITVFIPVLTKQKGSNENAETIRQAG